MSMLAEPRRKEKWSVDPRNTQWSSDKSKFGYQMLTKMGWNEGDGLGAKQDGRKSHVKVTVKNNRQGIGTSTSNSDGWIDHQDEFAALLERLNQNSDGPSAKKKAKSVSLEESVKQSRKKIFYSKFIKSKDLSRASNQDLACIFGQRSKSAPATPQDQSESKLAELSAILKQQQNDNTSRLVSRQKRGLERGQLQNMQKSTKNRDEGSTSDESTTSCPVVNGFVTTKSQYNVQEYFAKRMAELQSKKMIKEERAYSDETNAGCVVNDVDKEDNVVQNEGNEKNEKRKKRKNSSKMTDGNLLKEDHNREDNPSMDCASEQVFKTKKKKRKPTSEAVVENESEQRNDFDFTEERKPAGDDDASYEANFVGSRERSSSEDQEVKHKKSRKNKRKSEFVVENDEEKNPKTDSKRKEYCMNADSLGCIINGVNVNESCPPLDQKVKRKKSKKNKRKAEDFNQQDKQHNCCSSNDIELESTVKKKKGKKKPLDLENDPQSNSYESGKSCNESITVKSESLDEGPSHRKKKKKRKQKS